MSARTSDQAPRRPQNQGGFQQYHVVRALFAASAALLFLGSGSPGVAGEADVVDVIIRKQNSGSFVIRVTIRHDDEGWDHYADKWDVTSPDGTVLATRILHHPHVDEQPFTRSLSGVEIPPHVDEVTIRAHDSVHGYGGATVTVRAPR